MYEHDFSWRLPGWCHLIALTLGLAFIEPVLAAEGRQALTLEIAVSRALEQNPKLRVYAPRLRGLEGQRLTADQSPAYTLGFEAENILGSGALSGTDAAEYTVSLSSVIELGGKREARTRVVSGAYGKMEAERRAQTLSLLGQVTRQFISTLALQERVRLAGEAVELAESTYDLVSRRAGQGAAPQAEVLRARAQLRQSRLEQNRLTAAYDSRRQSLATLLGEETADFKMLEGDLFAFTGSENFPDLFQRARENPAILIYASEERLREAQLELARSQSQSDIRWQVGARHLEAIGDSALVAGVSIPLFSGRRNRGEVQAATAARDEVGYRRESALLDLRSRLYEAYRLHQQGVAAADAMENQILPDLREALALTRDAYEQGRYSYIEWQAAQRELLSAQRDRADAATTALLNQSVIEQLTAQPLAASDPASGQ